MQIPNFEKGRRLIITYPLVNHYIRSPLDYPRTNLFNVYSSQAKRVALDPEYFF